jgi:hypothetical protein
LEWVEVVSLGAEFEWNGGWLAEEVLILGEELGLDTLKWGVGTGKVVETMEPVWLVRDGMSVTVRAQKGGGGVGCRLDQSVQEAMKRAQRAAPLRGMFPYLWLGWVA